jgi:hypothetical protein
MNYELKHIRGIPYYLHGTSVYTFELNAGKPSSDCLAIGTYHPAEDRIAYADNWKELVQPRLDAFRLSLQSQERSSLRDSIIKPQKQRKATRVARKPVKGAACAVSE